MQTRYLPAHDGKTRTGYFGRGFKIELTQRLSYIDMIMHSKIEETWLTPLAYFNIIVLIFSIGNGAVRNVGDAGKYIFQFTLYAL